MAESVSGFYILLKFYIVFNYFTFNMQFFPLII